MQSVFYDVFRRVTRILAGPTNGRVYVRVFASVPIVRPSVCRLSVTYALLLNGAF